MHRHGIIADSSRNYLILKKMAADILSPLEIVHFLSSSSSSSSSFSSSKSALFEKSSKHQLLNLLHCRESLEKSSDQLRESESLYQRALANGIDELVGRFLSSVAECETVILNNESTGAVESRCEINLIYALRCYISVFPVLKLYVADIVLQNLTGGPLLSSLYHRSQDGDEFLSQCFSTLLWHTSQPFFGQISRWMSHADIDNLFDLGGGKDFFIRRTRDIFYDPKTRQTKALLIASSITDNSSNIKTSESIEHEIRVIASTSRITGDKSSFSPSFLKGQTEVESLASNELQQCMREYAWAQEYSLHYDAIPVPFVTEALAESVLAVGKAVSLLKLYNKSQANVQGVGFLLKDSFAISELLESMRKSKTFSLVAAECVINRIRENVYNRLWSLLVHDSLILHHISSVRSFLLLGRGDFFQAFLELSRKTVMTNPATSSSILSLLQTGPWERASMLVNLRSEDFSLPRTQLKTLSSSSVDEVSQGGYVAFERVSLKMSYRALRFEGMSLRVAITSEAKTGSIDYGDDINMFHSKSPLLSGTRIGSSSSYFTTLSNGALQTHTKSESHNATFRKQSQTCSSLLSSWAQPCSLSSAERILRLSRSSAQLLLLGASAVVTHSVLSDVFTSAKTQSTARGDQNTTNKSIIPNILDRNITIASHSNSIDGSSILCIDRLLLSRPQDGFISSAQRSSTSKHTPTGALWMFQPVHVTRGFLLRVALGLGSNIGFNLAPGITEQPASFAVVIHRDHSLALGTPNSTASTASNSGGFNGIQNSIAIHVLCKRVHSTTSASSPIFRVVVAIYGPPGPMRLGKSGGERRLIASGLAEVNLQVDGICSVQSQSASIDAVSRCLALAIEYIPPGSSVLDLSASSPVNSARVQLGSRGRIQVSILEGGSTGCLLTDLSIDSRRSSIHTDTIDSNLNPSLSTKSSQLQRLILESPIVLEDVLNFAGVHGPGCGRAWVGLTSEAPIISVSTEVNVKSILSSPLVWVDALDFISYSEADDGYLGLGLRYEAPWPLHLVIHSGSLAVYQDLFRFGLRVKSVALALQEAWRLLTDISVVDAAIGIRQGGRLTSHIPKSEDGVSAQVSGRGGKSSDLAARTRDIQRRAAHVKLHSVWIARSQLQLFISALLYHFQVDVIECSYVKFIKIASEAKSFASLQVAHEEYLRSMLEGSGLLQPSVNGCINRLLSHCDRFVSLVSTHAQSDSLLTLASSTALSDLLGVFQNDMVLFRNFGGFERLLSQSP
jgi:hypothetical protein